MDQQLARALRFLREAPKRASAFCVEWNAAYAESMIQAIQNDRDFEALNWQRHVMRIITPNMVELIVVSMTSFRPEVLQGRYVTEVIWPDIRLVQPPA